MNQRRFLAVALFLFPLCLSAQLVPSEEQTREWTEKHPPKGLTITNSDRNVDYKREGKIVFRTVKRTVTVTQGPSQLVAKADQHIIEFVADGNVFASIGLDKAAAQSLTIISGPPVYFTTGFAGPDKRFFYVCVPKNDYFEYIEATGTDITLPRQSAESYAAMKRANFKIAEKGYINPLGKEELLDTEKPR